MNLSVKFFAGQFSYEDLVDFTDFERACRLFGDKYEEYSHKIKVFFL